MTQHADPEPRPESPQSGLFRAEALQQFRWRGAQGAVLRSTPRAIRYAYAVVIAVVVGGLLFITLGKLNLYSTGPLVIRVDGRSELTALTAGAVAQVAVRPGQRVERGQLLVRFDTQVLEGELARLRSEYDDQTRARLRNPADDAPRAALMSLRAQIDLTARRLREHSVLAPSTGTITDVRIRPGQMIAEGGSLCTLVTDSTRARVVAMLPARDRPRLRIGGQLRVELDGYPYAYRQVRIGFIGDEAVGPAEVQRFLGAELADTLQISGPVILVEAQLPGPMFAFEGQSLRYVDGMSGRADAKVRRERIAVVLLPALKALFGSAS
jgi:membrane fusion protein (multidrug efflux system)